MSNSGSQEPEGNPDTSMASATNTTTTTQGIPIPQKFLPHVNPALWDNVANIDIAGSVEISQKDLSTFILWHLAIYQQEDLLGRDLWSAAQRDFEGWSEGTSKKYNLSL
ncbi:glycosyl transferase [Colletotrichum tofieldiae]|nr:glycosyl transferase [Colletotrichum tofieldiae]